MPEPLHQPNRTHTPRIKQKDGCRQWEFPGTFLGLPAASTGTSVKQLKGHLHRSATCGRPLRQVMAFAGLFRDI